MYGSSGGVRLAWIDLPARRSDATVLVAVVYGLGRTAHD